MNRQGHPVHFVFFRHFFIGFRPTPADALGRGDISWEPTTPFCVQIFSSFVRTASTPSDETDLQSDTKDHDSLTAAFSSYIAVKSL